MQSDISKYLSPIPERPTLIETLASDVLSLIKDAGLQPGDRLPSEQAIVEATNAGRSSVREALRALKTLGVIETKPGVGSFVKDVDPAGLIRHETLSIALRKGGFSDIIDARKVLECEVAWRAAQCEPDQLAQLREILDEARAQVGAGQELYETTWAFHMTLAELGGNPVIAKLVQVLYDMIHDWQLETYWPKIDPEEEVESHRELYEAILDGPEEAQQAMRDHLDRVVRVVNQSIGELSISDTA